MKKKIIYGAFLCASLSAVIMACSDDPEPSPSIVKEWNLVLSAKNENPAPAGRNEAGTANLQLLSDNTMKYTIAVTNLTAGDVLTQAHIHTGDVISNGVIIVNFAPTFAGANASGIIPPLRTTFIDSLKDNTNDLYFNVHSTQLPGGLVRAPLNTTLNMVADVVLLGTNEVPPVVTTAVGLALLRLTTDKKLYSKVTVTGLEANDALTNAHIHAAATGVNGPVIQLLANGAAEFNVNKVVTLSDALITQIKTDPVYVNAHSVNRVGGVVRGQIR